MRRPVLLVCVGLALLAGGIGLSVWLVDFPPVAVEDPPPKAPQAATPELYPGFRQDVASLRKTSRLNPQSPNASSAEACRAADQIFRTAPLVGKTRAEVLQWLGDPRTVSDYGVPAGTGENSPLVYRIDS